MHRDHPSVKNMTGPEHFAEAKRLMEPRREFTGQRDSAGAPIFGDRPTPDDVARAGVHLMFAQIAATVAVARDPHDPAWDRVISESDGGL